MASKILPRRSTTIIEFAGLPVGVINLAAIDLVNRHATWGLYLGEKLNSPIGGMIPVYFYNYVFARSDLNLHKLYGIVLKPIPGCSRCMRSAATGRWAFAWITSGGGAVPQRACGRAAARHLAGKRQAFCQLPGPL